ncbi:VPS10 domain-containing protein [Saccharicrinis aurantiacus]|uniref:VPS10 domain-containing protein n=1 Tax=Saccharicrinis aurantiacus TaxID=1849719 RepID=UPI0024933EE2|nr:Ig-like domain-containing protein [Saccharicrinis aurantiacus]
MVNKNQLKQKAFLLVAMALLQFSSLSAQFQKKLNTERVESDHILTWEQVGPGNAGYANLLRFHPTIPGKIVQVPDMWNAYQSDDYGKNWYSIKDYDGDGSFYHLRDIYYSPKNPDFGLAIGTSELFRTTNGGKNWSVVPNCPWYKKDVDGTDKDAWRKKVGSLAIDPNNPNVWFVGGGQNVRGQMWMSIYKHVTAENPHGRKELNEGKLWRTADGGKSWQLVNNGIHQKAQVGRIIVNPNNSKEVFAASNFGMYRSSNGGKSWKQVGKNQFDNNIIMDMDAYYNKQTGKFTIYAIDQTQYFADGKTTKCSGGIFKSDDAGKSWVNITGNLGLDINRLTGGVPANYYQYIAHWFGIKKQEAKTKYPELPKAALQNFNMISADPSREGAVYIGFTDPQTKQSITPGRLWVTTNDGEKWISTARLYEETWEKDKAYWEERGNPWHTNMKVGHQSPHMRFKKDYPLRSMRALDVGVDGAVMIVSDHSSMLSKDHGKTWQQMDEVYTPSGAIVGNGNSNLPGLVIAQDKRKETTLLGSGEHYVWIPSDDSPNDRIAARYIESSQPTVSNIVYDPYNVDEVYNTSNRQEDKQYMFKSSDRGEHWAKHGTATPATNKWLDDYYTNGLAIDPINPEYMYFGITKIVKEPNGKKGGFFRSEDGGKTFTQSNKGLPSPARINDVQFDPRDNSMKSLFIAAEKNIHSYHLPLSEGGLYHSTNRGESWKKVNTPAAVEGVQFVKFDHTNRMYITTGYRGGGAGVWYSDDFGKNWTQIFEHAPTECIDICPFDNNLIAITTRFMSPNPGLYISRDRGQTWVKANKGLGTPHQIEDVKFDIFEPSKMWLATLGCGFYRGEIEGGDQIKVVDMSTDGVELNKGDQLQLKASIIQDKFKGEKLVWKSENTAVAKVNKKGEVTAVSNGLVKIWATTKDGRYADYAMVTVKRN